MAGPRWQLEQGSSSPLLFCESLLSSKGLIQSLLSSRALPAEALNAFATSQQSSTTSPFPSPLGPGLGCRDVFLWPHLWFAYTFSVPLHTMCIPAPFHSAHQVMQGHPKGKHPQEGFIKGRHPGPGQDHRTLHEALQLMEQGTTGPDITSSRQDESRLGHDSMHLQPLQKAAMTQLRCWCSSQVLPWMP